MLEEDNVVQITQEDLQFPSSYQEEDMEGHEAHVQMPDRPGDMVQGAIPTSLPQLATSRQRTPKHMYKSMKVSLVCLKVRYLNTVLHIKLNRYLSTILILNVTKINVDYLYCC